MLLIFFNLVVFNVSCLLAFSSNLFMTHSYLARWKKDERLVLSFHFVSFVLNVIVFVYNKSKQSHILQTMPTRLLQFYFFHRKLVYVYLKNSILRCMWRDLGIWVCRYVSHIGLHLLFCISEFCINLTRDLFLVSRGKKKADKVCICKSSIIPSYLKLVKLHTGFSTNPCFLRMG